MVPIESSRRDLQSGNGPGASRPQKNIEIQEILQTYFKEGSICFSKQVLKDKMGVKWVGSGRGRSTLCQDDQLETPEVLGLILTKNS